MSLVRQFAPQLGRGEQTLLGRRVANLYSTGDMAGAAKALGTSAERLTGAAGERNLGLYGKAKAQYPSWAVPHAQEGLNKARQAENLAADNFMATTKKLPVEQWTHTNSEYAASQRALQAANAQMPMARRNLLQARARQQGDIRSETAWNARADAMATSGRHGTPQITPDTQLDMGKALRAGGGGDFGSGGTNAYRGFTAQNPLAPTGRADVGAPVWWSGHPESVTQYAGSHNPQAASYLVAAPPSALAAAGPSSPNFHQHLYYDTRHMTPQQISAAPYQATPFATNPRSSVYERVFTESGTPAPRMSSFAMKSLPSGRSWQTLKQNGPALPARPAGLDQIHTPGQVQAPAAFKAALDKLGGLLGTRRFG